MEGDRSFDIQFLKDGTYQLSTDKRQLTFTTVKAMTSYINRLAHSKPDEKRKRHGKSLPFDEG